MKPSLFESFRLLFALLIGFGVGVLHSTQHSQVTPIYPLEKFREISLIQLQAIEGDALQVDISGPARILWNEEMVENDGHHEIPLGQIETENDRSFRNYPYLGNSKTNNFYPSDSYPARGTELQYRRFFESKEAALSAGFNASKLVK